MADKFSYYDLGQLQSGQIVEVTLKGNAANVRLMDSSNYNNYKRGAKHTYYGGLAERSPVRLQVPRTTRWYVTIDLQGMGGLCEPQCSGIAESIANDSRSATFKCSEFGSPGTCPGV